MKTFKNKFSIDVTEDGNYAVTTANLELASGILCAVLDDVKSDACEWTADAGPYRLKFTLVVEGSGRGPKMTSKAVH